VRDQALSVIAAFEQSDSLVYVNAVAWLAVRAMAQMALLADLRNPTFKKALVKVRDVLAAYDMAEEHRELLRLLGAAELDDGTILGRHPIAGRRWTRPAAGCARLSSVTTA
jgi:hypothetical protein